MALYKFDFMFYVYVFNNMYCTAGVRFTCVGWQVTLCDPIWQMTSRSFEVEFSPGRAISALPYLTLLMV